MDKKYLCDWVIDTHNAGVRLIQDAKTSNIDETQMVVNKRSLAMLLSQVLKLKTKIWETDKSEDHKVIYIREKPGNC